MRHDASNDPMVFDVVVFWPTEMLAPEDDSDTESERTSKEKKKTKVMNHLKKVDMKIKKTMSQY